MAFHLKIALATGALLLSAGAASAQSATATTALNVRSGPGTEYGVIDTLPEGEIVRLLGCTGAWCEISLGASGTGFASAAYLDRDGGGGRVVIEEPEPEIITGLSIGGYWSDRPYYYDDGFYYYGGRWYGERPGRPGWERSWRRDHHWRGHGRSGGWAGRDPRRPGGWSGRDRDDRPGADRDRGPDRDRDRVTGRYGDGWPNRGDRGGDRGPRGDRGANVDRGDRGAERGGDRGSGGRLSDMTGPTANGGGRDIGRGGGGDRGDRVGLDRAGGGGGGGAGRGGGGGGGGGGRGDGGGRGGDRNGR